MSVSLQSSSIVKPRIAPLGSTATGNKFDLQLLQYADGMNQLMEKLERCSNSLEKLIPASA